MYGSDWIQVLYSISFSVARCRRPICGSTRSITSPSSSSTSRSTPCAAGCCGPKLMVKLRSDDSAIVSAQALYSQFAIRYSPRLVGDAGVELVPRHHETFVAARADLVDAIMGLHLE